MKLPFLTNSKSLDQNISSSSQPPWPWPACAHIKTLSFRGSDPKDANFTTFNSVFLDTQVTTPDSFFTFSSSCRSDSSVVSDDVSDPVESVIRSLRSDRLFFDLHQGSSLVSMAKETRITSNNSDNNEETRITSNDSDNNEEPRMVNNGVELQEGGSKNRECKKKEEEIKENGVKESKILSMEANNPSKCTQTLSLSRECINKEEIKEDGVKEVYRESEILSMESNNPYEDFKRSMEEMVEAHGLKEWQGLEELLDCYLKMNGDENHGFIVGAFIDMLVSLSISSNTSTPMSSSSSSSNVTSSSSSSLLSSSISSPLSPSCLHPILDDDDGVDDDNESG